MKRIEDIISKCVEGRASRDIIREIEEELPDITSIHRDVRTECKRAGLSTVIECDDTVVKISSSNELSQSEKQRLMTIVDTYSRTYPEFEFVVASDS